MRREYLALITVAMLVAASAAASPVATWSGAGPNACNGRCDQTWAETHLTDEQRTQLYAVMRYQPVPEPLWVEDGAYMPLMTYWLDGSPRAVHGSTVAVLTGPERAIGWQMNGWTFARLDACQNWAVIKYSSFTIGSIASSLSHASGSASVGENVLSLNDFKLSASDSGIFQSLVEGPWTIDRAVTANKLRFMLFRSFEDTPPFSNEESLIGISSIKSSPDIFRHELSLPVVSLPASGPALVLAFASLICIVKIRERQQRST